MVVHNALIHFSQWRGGVNNRWPLLIQSLQYLANQGTQTQIQWKMYSLQYSRLGKLFWNICFSLNQVCIVLTHSINLLYNRMSSVSIWDVHPGWPVTSAGVAVGWLGFSCGPVLEALSYNLLVHLQRSFSSFRPAVWLTYFFPKSKIGSDLNL